MKSQTILNDILSLTGLQERRKLTEALYSILTRELGDRPIHLYQVLKGEDAEAEEMHLINARSGAEVAGRGVHNAVQEVVRTGRAVFHRLKKGTHGHFLFPISDSRDVREVLLVESPDLTWKERSQIRLYIAIYTNQLRLLQHCERDPLTGLLNRNALNRRIDQVVQEVSRHGHRMNDDNTASYFVILDIDHFKKVNDTFGHLMGDEILIHMSRILERCFRFSDMVFRYGGEEFAILLINVPVDKVEMVLERARSEVHTHPFPSSIRITFSAGYTRIEPQEFSIHIVESADRALYYAKANGRDRICSFNSLIEEKLILDSDYERSDVTLWR